jgi:hypothetical protein
MLGRCLLALVVAGPMLGSGCGVRKGSASQDGSAAADREDNGRGEAAEAATGIELLGAPLIFAPTQHGFGLNVVLRSGDPSALRVRVRGQAETNWTEMGPPSSPAGDIAQWSVDGLQPGRVYLFEVRGPDPPETGALYQGAAVTARDPGSPFTFAILSDTHIAPRDSIPPAGDTNSFQEITLLEVARAITASHPDFLVNLGDMLDFHRFGFNDPPPDASWTRLGYLNYRRLLGDALGQAAHFPVIGNWDGENGCNTPEEIQRSGSQRRLYVPGPRPGTYREGGSPDEDYYAFTWGDALFVVLNVMTYTPTCHLLGAAPGFPDDWTLGPAQLAWLEATLAGATSRWRFLFIHHAVGGAAGDYANSAYGRGGGQAARVGEQAIIHDMMIRHGVQIFFYGHDHVFTDMLVDGIHYTLPGSAGAPWKFVTAETGYTEYWPDSGYGRVAVSKERLQVDFVGPGDQVLKSYSVE